MEQGQPGSRGRNRAILWMIGGLVVVGAVLPPVWSRLEQPTSAYATYAPAREAAARSPGLMPRRLPASAYEIHEKHLSDARHRWVRFRFGPADAPAMVAGLRPLSPAQVERLQIPSPGWSGWWMLDQGITTSSQGKRLAFYRTEDGWLAVDARTSTAYFWT